MFAHQRSTACHINFWRHSSAKKITLSRTFVISESRMSHDKSDYEILGIKPNASKSEIKAAYFKKAKEFHPDTENTKDASHFMQINEAYKRLIYVKNIHGKTFPSRKKDLHNENDPRVREFWRREDPFGDPGSREYWEMRNRRTKNMREQFEEEMKWKKAQRERDLGSGLRTTLIIYFVIFFLCVMSFRPPTLKTLVDRDPVDGCRCEKCALKEMQNNPKTSRIIKSAAVSS